MCDVKTIGADAFVVFPQTEPGTSQAMFDGYSGGGGSGGGGGPGGRGGQGFSGRGRGFGSGAGGGGNFNRRDQGMMAGSCYLYKHNVKEVFAS